MNIATPDRFNRLNLRCLTHIWRGVSLRPLFAILIAIGMLFAPFAMQSGSAMAMAPADHQSQMMESGNCGEQPAKEKDGKSLNKSCCVAMCAAIAVAPVPPLEPHAFAKGVDHPSLASLHNSYLARLPTPPPRGA